MAHLSHHDGEGEHANKVVDELEDDLEQRGRVRQPADGDQALHGKVVAADVAEERPKGRSGKGRRRVCVLSARASRSPVALAVVDPTGGPQSGESGAPVVQAGVAVEAVKEVSGGADHPAGR